jgi:hypothetical protein
VTNAELLRGLQAEYQNWLALLDEIGPANMEQPGVTGTWSIKDIVAHLTGWRRRTVARLQAAQRGEPEPPPPWPPHLQTDDEINAWIYQAHKDDWVDTVLAESHAVFQQLLAAIEALPAAMVADAASHFPWMEGRSFTAAEFFGHFHEEHEPEMRAWLARIKQ